jgi:hypothetical protein
LGAFARKRARNLPLNSEMAKRPFGCVVIPRDAISLQEGENRFAVAIEPLLILSDQLLTTGTVVNGVPVERINPLLVLAQVASFQSESLDEVLPKNPTSG